MPLRTLFGAKRSLMVLLVLALAVIVACGGSATEEADETDGSGPAPTAAQTSGGDATPTPVRAATPTPTALPDDTPTPIPTAETTFAGVGVQGGHARFLTTEYPELWDPHLMGTIVGLEGGSPLYNQVLEIQPHQPRHNHPRPSGELGEVR